MYKYIRKIPKNNMNKYMNRDAWSIRKDREKVYVTEARRTQLQKTSATANVDDISQ